MPRVFKKSIVRYLNADGRQVPKQTPGARKVKEKSKKWYGRVPGAADPVPLCLNKSAAEILLNELVKKAEMAKAGVVDKFEPHRKRPLSEHLDDFRAVLQATNCGARYIRDTVAAVQRIIAGCGFVFIDDISLSAVQKYLAALLDERPQLPPLDSTKEWYTKKELAAALGVKPHCIPPLVKRWRLAATGNGKKRRYPRATALALRERQERPIGLGTINHYIGAIKSFTAWLVGDKRTDANALVQLSGFNAAADLRRGRRALAPEQLQCIFQAAINSVHVFRGLAGPDRYMLYLTACITGYRAGELALLTPESFALAEEPPAVVLGAEHTKNGKTATQPIPGDMADLLGAYLSDKPAGLPVWPGGWADNAADMLRIDLDAVGIPYAVEGPDGLLYADFHSLRHSYVALLDRSGATLKEAMALARHSDPKLTMARYGKAQLHDLAGKIEQLPRLLNTTPVELNEQRLRATGTDNAATILDSSCSPVAQTCATERDSLITVEHLSMNDGETGRKTKPLVLQGVEDDCERLIASDFSSPSRIRTYNKPVNSRLLYR